MITHGWESMISHGLRIAKWKISQSPLLICICEEVITWVVASFEYIVINYVKTLIHFNEWMDMFIACEIIDYPRIYIFCKHARLQLKWHNIVHLSISICHQNNIVLHTPWYQHLYPSIVPYKYSVAYHRISTI